MAVLGRLKGASESGAESEGRVTFLEASQRRRADESKSSCPAMLEVSGRWNGWVSLESFRLGSFEGSCSFLLNSDNDLRRHTFDPLPPTRALRFLHPSNSNPPLPPLPLSNPTKQPSASTQTQPASSPKTSPSPPPSPTTPPPPHTSPLPLDEPKLRLHHIRHAQHAPGRDIGNRQLVPDQEVGETRFHEAVNRFDRAVYFAQLSRYPFG